MKVKVKVFKNRQRLPLKRQEIVKLVERVVREEAPERGGEVSVIFLQDKDIVSLNRQFLNHDYPTDVLAFNLEENPGEALEGEIYVGFEQAKRQAGEWNVPFRQELQRLVVHGMLHLLGWEDDTPAKKKKMAKREDDFLFEISNKHGG